MQSQQLKIAVFLFCAKCGSEYRLEKLGPATQVTNKYHCPTCGALCNARQDIDRNYWWLLAESWLPPATEDKAIFLEQLYSLWGQDENDPSKFVDFFKQMINNE